MEKSRQTTIKRLLEIRVCKKVLLKEEILPHQNSQFFQTHTNSNKISGPLNIQMKECILY